jgi:hypothetical protein
MDILYMMNIDGTKIWQADLKCTTSVSGGGNSAFLYLESLSTILQTVCYKKTPMSECHFMLYNSNDGSTRARINYPHGINDFV